MKREGLTRRYFFYGTLLAGAVPVGGFGSQPSLKTLGYKSPNEKLNIASIGAGGKRQATSGAARKQKTSWPYAMWTISAPREDVQQYEKLPKYKDFRVMLDKENNNIDAVIVTVPDFMHATAATWAMERGKHVYVQKPLAHTIWECRQLAETASEIQGCDADGQPGLLERRHSPVRRDDLGRRDRQRD